MMEYRGSTAEFMDIPPRTRNFTKRVIEDYHQRTLHGGVQATMCGKREKFWILKFRRAVSFTTGPLKPPATGFCQYFAVNWVNCFKQLK